MDSHTLGIGELIEHEREFTVPDHQRDFAWGDDEVGQLFIDVTRALDEDSPDYFLGLVVLVQAGKGGPLQILDGQQRLATTTMIYAGIREWLHAAGFEKDAQKVQSDHIGLLELGEDADRPRLTLNINDREIFQELVVDRANDENLEKKRDEAGRHSSQRKVADAALNCRSRVAAYASEQGGTPAEQAKALYHLATYLRDKVTVVKMEVSSETDAYVIFESLNDRGLDLSVLDLVKNHLFGRSGGELEKVKHNWAQMTAHIGDRSADDFLKVFWTSKYGRIQRGKLFQEWRKRFDSLKSTQVVDLTSELVTAANRFAALDTPEDEVWRGYSKELRAGVGDLALLGNRQMRPILLAAIDGFSAKELENLVKRLIVATFRYQVVGKRRTGALEIATARAAKAIADSKANKAEKVWDELASIVPDDDDFQADFTRYSEPKAQIAKYVLRRLEIEAQRRDSGSKPELEPSADLTLEHVLPQNPGESWNEVLKADPELEDYVDRLGNLCLLNEAPNKEAANSSFADKSAEIYKESSLLLTRTIAEKYDAWDRTSIRARQEYLASLATAVWALP